MTNLSAVKSVFCPKCGTQNARGDTFCQNAACQHHTQPLPSPPVSTARGDIGGYEGGGGSALAVSRANSFKLSTAVFILLGLFLPLWPVTLPLGFYMAYRSYKDDWSI